jgi:hypothetical protein
MSIKNLENKNYVGVIYGSNIKDKRLEIQISSPSPNIQLPVGVVYADFLQINNRVIVNGIINNIECIAPNTTSLQFYLTFPNIDLGYSETSNVLPMGGSCSNIGDNGDNFNLTNCGRIDSNTVNLLFSNNNTQLQQGSLYSPYFTFQYNLV